MFLWRLSDNMHINRTQKTAEAKWNSAIIYYYTCAFPPSESIYGNITAV